MRAGIAVADILAGLYAAIGIMAALAERRSTGVGRRVDLSLLEVQLASLVNLASNYLLTGARPTRLGNAHPSIAPYEVFQSEDGYLAIAVATEDQWARFAVAIGRADLAADPRATRNGDRVANRPWLTNELATIIRSRTTSTWVAKLRAADVPCGPVNTVDAVLDDPHTQALDLISSFERDGKAMHLVGSPLRFSGEPRRAPIPPPRLGEHTNAVLTELLQLSPEEIRSLRDASVV
jgi:crotonobetainyl-CoA:carnitine CoA-transferase CaiB-like acyl-CoA transferase